MRNMREFCHTTSMYERLCASENFRNFFSSDTYDVDYSKNQTDLETAFLKYCTNYLREIEVSYDEEDTEDIKKKFFVYYRDPFGRLCQRRQLNTYKSHILRGYRFLGEELKNKFGTYNSKYNIIEPLIRHYSDLIRAISYYHFSTRSGNDSYLSRQNEVNVGILLELAALKPVLLMVSDNINHHYDENFENSDNSFEIELADKLFDLSERLDFTTIKLHDCEKEYHDTCGAISDIRKELRDSNLIESETDSGEENIDINLGDDGADSRAYRYQDLKKLQKEWRVSRNNACSDVIDFYKSLLEINDTLDQKSVIYPKEEIYKKYSDALCDIFYGPFSHCYLTSEEKETVKEGTPLQKKFYVSSILWEE